MHLMQLLWFLSQLFKQTEIIAHIKCGGKSNKSWRSRKIEFPVNKHELLTIIIFDCTIDTLATTNNKPLRKNLERFFSSDSIMSVKKNTRMDKIKTTNGREKKRRITRNANDNAVSNIRHRAFLIVYLDAMSTFWSVCRFIFVEIFVNYIFHYVLVFFLVHIALCWFQAFDRIIRHDK